LNGTMRFEITRAMKSKKTKSHQHSAEDRRGNGDRRTRSRRADHRVVVGEKVHDRRREPRRQDERKD
jgi:hypothetical protein